MFSAKKLYVLWKNPEIELNGSVLSEIWAKKRLKTAKKKTLQIALILLINTGFKLDLSVSQIILLFGWQHCVLPCV